MKFQFLACILTVILPLACSDSVRQTKQASNEIKNKVFVKNKPPGSFSDTLKINFPAAVFYNPDSLQLQKIKAITGPGVFESAVHDCFYQMRNARIVLKDYWPQVRIVETSKARYLLFIKSDKSKICMDLDSKKDMCGLILFNRAKGPLLADMMNIDTELDRYFKK